MIQELLPSAKRQFVLRREGEPVTHVSGTGTILEHQTKKRWIASLPSVGSLDWLDGVVDAVRPAIAPQERQAMRKPLVDLCLERIVVGYALVGDFYDIAKVEERLIKLAIGAVGYDARILVRRIADPQ